MVIKVEVYYELRRKSNKPFPEMSKTILMDKVKEEIPNKVTIVGDWLFGEEVTAHLLTQEQLLERIRTQK